MHKLPHRITVVCPGDDLCELPPGEFQFGDQPAAHGGRVLERLHDLSYYERVAAIHLQSLDNKVPVDGRTCNGDTVYELPQGDSMVCPDNDLRELSPGGLQWNDQSAARFRRFPDRLHDVSFDN